MCLSRLPGLNVEINEQHRISEIEQMIASSSIDDETKTVLLALVRHLQLHNNSLVNQLRKHAHIYTVNPHTDKVTTEGHKAGDICIYKNSQGDVELSQF